MIKIKILGFYVVILNVGHSCSWKKINKQKTKKNTKEKKSFLSLFIIYKWLWMKK